MIVAPHTIDKSDANAAAIRSNQADSGLPFEMRQSKYLNNLVEQDHRAVKRITRSMLGFKTFRCANPDRRHGCHAHDP